MFPFSDPLCLSGKEFTATQVLQVVSPLLTEERRQKIHKVATERCFDFVPVLENIYDRGNASAVMRSAEALGFAQVHMIELGEKFKESQRTTAGADKWTEVKKWKSTAECVQELKRQGKQIVVTHLSENSKPISDVDFSKPTALVLGNEKDGVSREMVQAADHCVLLPMVGFVQSYNISVAAALCFYQAFEDRKRRLGHSASVNAVEIEVLKAIYSLRTLDSGQDVLLSKRERGEI
jgi:tRNA (guanosine-2'-O-)-methyltransferase